MTFQLLQPESERLPRRNPALDAGAPEMGGRSLSAVEARPFLQVFQLSKMFGRFRALAGVSFEAGRGELLCVLGPSGCGKTTLLRVIAGLEKQESGQVLFEGRDVSHHPPSRRNVGIVFQSYALFPNLTAMENIAYGLKNRQTARAAVRKRAYELLQLVGLDDLGTKYPAQLSGGQQQRVALARAMALSPDLLLLDEPLSALDAQVRIMLRSEIKQLQRKLNVTTLMVTHDQEEALTMGDRILVMDRGEIVQSGTPMEIYDTPATPFVASFIGNMNFLENATEEGPKVCRVGHLRLTFENGSLPMPAGRRLTLAIRPEDVLVSEVAGSTNILTARVRSLEFRGLLYRATLSLPLCSQNCCTIQADITSEKVRRLKIREDMDLQVEFPPDRIRVYVA